MERIVSIAQGRALQAMDGELASQRLDQMQDPERNIEYAFQEKVVLLRLKNNKTCKE